MQQPQQERALWILLGLVLLGLACWRVLASSPPQAPSTLVESPQHSEAPEGLTPPPKPAPSTPENTSSDPKPLEPKTDGTDGDSSSQSSNEALKSELPGQDKWDVDDGGRLAILSPRSLMIVLSVTAHRANLDALHLKPIPYRQNNAQVRSPYSAAILDASGKTLFRAPVEVDNLCLEVGPDHIEDHCQGDIVFPHEAGAIFRVPVIAGTSQLLLLRQISGLDADEIELARMPLSLPPDALEAAPQESMPQDPK